MSAHHFGSDRLMSRRSLISAIEHVEPRRLLATLVGTELRIEGTAGNDRVRVETIGANVVVTQNAVAQSFAKTKVKTINANLRNGNDRIDIIWNVVATTTISGEGGNDTVIGGDYKDVIYTGSGNDFVYGGRGGDFIQTSTGNDFISPGSQNDTVDAGDGNDEVSYGDRSTSVSASLRVIWVEDYYTPQGVRVLAHSETRGSLTAAGEADTFNNAETLSTGSGNDYVSLIGEQGEWYFETPPRTHRINAGAGKDTLVVQQVFGSNVTPTTAVPMIGDAGVGDDKFQSLFVNDATLLGSEGNDTFDDRGDDDSLLHNYSGGSGIDTFITGFKAGYSQVHTLPSDVENAIVEDDWRIIGNALNNQITVRSSHGATIQSMGGNDIIDARASTAIVADGGEGNDTIYGGNADFVGDSILGNAGNDLILPGQGSDTINAGDGEDEVSYSDRSTGVDGSMYAILTYLDSDPNLPPVEGWVSRGEVRDGSEIDVLVSSEVLTGSSGNDSLSLEVVDGFNGTSYDSPFRSKVYRLNGGDGDDSLRTICLNDYYPGGVARITLDGGAGADYFNTYAICSVIGGKGDDSIDANRDDDSTAPTIDAGPGFDTFNFSRIGARYTMPPGLEQLVIESTIGGVFAIGNESSNVIIASARQGASFVDGRGGDDSISLFVWEEETNTTIVGGSGNDTLVGSTAIDCIVGGDGDDVLDGGPNADLLYGGNGRDSAREDGDDSIVDSIEVFF